VGGRELSVGRASSSVGRNWEENEDGKTGTQWIICGEVNPPEILAWEGFWEEGTYHYCIGSLADIRPLCGLTSMK